MDKVYSIPAYHRARLGKHRFYILHDIANLRRGRALADSKGKVSVAKEVRNTLKKKFSQLKAVRDELNGKVAPNIW